MRDVNPETIIDMLSWYKISPLNGNNLIREKPRLSQDNRKELTKALGADVETQSHLFTLTIPQNLAKLVNIYPGIIVRQHLTVQKHMGLPRGQYGGLKK